MLSIWHKDLRIEGNQIVYSDPVKTQCERLNAIAVDPLRSPQEKYRARQQAVRARNFYRVVQTAYEQVLPVRLIINEGDVRTKTALGSDSAHVDARRLDDAPWYVHSYDETTGEGLLVRDLRPAGPPEGAGLTRNDEDQTEDERQLTAIWTRRGQADFRIRVLGAWKRRCVVTECRVEALLEAAHIIPHALCTDYRTSNGLLLRADIHTLYDLQLLSIDEHMRIHVAPQLKQSEYRAYGGKRIMRLPELLTDIPSRNALRHRHEDFVHVHTSAR